MCSIYKCVHVRAYIWLRKCFFSYPKVDICFSAIPWREHNTFTQIDDNISFVIDKFTYLNLIVLAYWKQQSTSRRAVLLTLIRLVPRQPVVTLTPLCCELSEETTKINVLVSQRRGGSRGVHPAPPPLPLTWKKCDFWGVKSWFFTRNTPNIFEPPSARRNYFKCTSLTWNPGSTPAIYRTGRKHTNHYSIHLELLWFYSMPRPFSI